MIKYDLILCGKVIEWYWKSKASFLGDNRKQVSRLGDIIEQHRIVYSEQLADVYKDTLPLEILIPFKKYIESIAGIANRISYVSVEDISNDYDNSLSKISTKGNLDNPCIVCGECETKDKMNEKESINNIAFLSLIQDKSIYNRIGRVSTDFHIDVRAKEKMCEYLLWIKELFRNEKDIIICDSFILCEDKWDILEKMYLDSAEKGSRIRIYTKKKWLVSDVNIKTWLRKVANNNSISIQVFTCKKGAEPEHDRFIYIGPNRVRIGFGLDFIDMTGGCVFRNTHIDLERVGTNNQEIIELSTIYEHYTTQGVATSK